MMCQEQKKLLIVGKPEKEHAVQNYVSIERKYHQLDLDY